MDHPHFRYAPLPARPRWRWPGGARTAAYVLLHFEHWELIAPEGALRDPRYVGEFGSYAPDYRTWTQRDYGNRIGAFRVLDALDHAGLVPAVAAGALAIDRCPRLAGEYRRRGCEFVAHGVAATRLVSSRMSDAEERATIERSIGAIERLTGRRPEGWCAQDAAESARTPRLVAEAGLSYLLDWPNDDAPYLMATAPPIVSIPTQPEWDDVEAQWLRRVSPPRWSGLVTDAFDALHAEGGRVFGLAVHPWLSGMPTRIRYLREALVELRRRSDVWWTSPGAIARHCAALASPAARPA